MMYCPKCYAAGAEKKRLPPCPTEHFKRKP